MKKLLLLMIILAFSLTGMAQSYTVTEDGKCVLEGQKQTNIVQVSRDEIGDFTVTDSEGNTWHLYGLLAQGKTVFIDLFFST
jgi:hypothetical protein